MNCSIWANSQNIDDKQSDTLNQSIAKPINENATERWIDAPTLEIRGSSVADFAEAYELALRVVEYNMNNGLIEAGKGYGTWTRDTSINAWNATSLLIPAMTKKTLLSQTVSSPNGDIIGGQFWDKVIWIIAAYNYVQVTGDKEFLAKAYLVSLQTLNEMHSTQFDQQTGLYRGPAVYADGISAYPDPLFDDSLGDNILSYPDGYKIEALSTNSVYYGALKATIAMANLLEITDINVIELKQQSTDLRNSIQDRLWIKSQKRFAYFLDVNGSINNTQESLGEAIAILLNVANRDQIDCMFNHVHITPWGVPNTWPLYNRYFDPQKIRFGRHNGTIWPFINAFWVHAAALYDRPKFFSKEFIRMTQLAINSQDFREMYHPYLGIPYGGFQAGKNWDSIQHQTWSATGYLRIVYQGLFGINFKDNGLYLNPFIPSTLGVRSITLKNLHYRNMELNIYVKGTGNKIIKCELDGRRQQSTFISSMLTGKHSIYIALK
jgi:hypothetical protein